MRNQELLSKVIPPNNREHRESFSNKKVIDELNQEDRSVLEGGLLNLLAGKVYDPLIWETLAYLGSKKALPYLQALLENETRDFMKVMIGSFMYAIDPKEDILQTSIENFRKIKDKSEMTSAFFYLLRFNNPATEQEIKRYETAPDFITSYHARRALEQTAGSDFSVLAKAKLGPLFREYGFINGEERHDYLHYCGTVLSITLSRSNRDYSNSVFLMRNAASPHSFEINDEMLRDFFSTGTRLNNLPTVLFFENAYEFFSGAGRPLMEQDAAILAGAEQFSLEQSKKYSARFEQQQ